MTANSSEDDRLRTEAAAWIARMQRTDADRSRSELDAWLLADPRHRAIYERMSARFAEGALLRHSEIYGRSRVRRRRVNVAYGISASALAAVAACIVLLSWPSTQMSHTGHDRSAVAQPHREIAGIRFETEPAEIMAVRLADGSFVTIDGNSVLEVAFGRNRRDLVLRRGRARFEVAHEVRPFVVAAGEGTVTARGTIFDVSLGKANEVRVTLLRGAVDVASAGAPAKRMEAGQRIAMLTGSVSSVALLDAEGPTTRWADGLADYDSVPLSSLVDRANHYAVRPIILGDRSLGALRASGRFRVDDPERLQANLARLFDLTVDTSEPNKVILRRR